MQFLTLLALGAQLAGAIQLTTPTGNSTVTEGQDVTVSWSTVDTDPDTFSILLVNFVNWPPFYELLAENVETSKQSYTVQIPCDVDPSYGFQINAINGTNVYVIYAQTSDFTIAQGTCNTATTSSANPTVTVFKTLGCSPTGTGNATYTYTHPTSGAKVPRTIGWGQDGYGYPVTLTAVPTATETGAAGVSSSTAASKKKCSKKAKRNHAH